jgi:hypothetical protein
MKLLHKLNILIESASSTNDITNLSTTHAKYLKAVQKAKESDLKENERKLAK